MHFLQVIGSLRTTRFFQAWRPVERAKIQKMLEAARLASRAMNVAFAKAVVTYREWLTPQERDALKTPMASVEFDLAPVYIFWFYDTDAGRRAVEERPWPTVPSGAIVDVGALPPTHGWSSKYVSEVILPQVLRPLWEMGPRRGGHPDAGMAMEQALLCAVDEGLGVCLVPFNEEGARRVLRVPDTWEPLQALLVGYSAESAEGAGQIPLGDFEGTFFEGNTSTPFRRDPRVVEHLREDGLIQQAPPIPWRKQELRALARMFGLPQE